jgi:Family of unknown function (DUF6101)
LRRQSEFGGTACGSSRTLRLDPCSLPIRFTAGDASADERIRIIELYQERIVLRRSVRGIRMAVNVPLACFLGVCLRLGCSDQDDWVSICLEHRDKALCVPLLAGVQGSDVIPQWQLWARVLGLPLLVVDPHGTLREPFRRIGALRLGTTTPRRRRRDPIRARRPSMPLRRRRGLVSGEPKVHRGEREIIARS